MASKRKGRKAGPNGRAARWLGILLIAAGLFVAIALLTLDSGTYAASALDGGSLSQWIADRALSFAPPSLGPFSGNFRNATGPLGVLVATLLLGSLGWVLSGLVPVVFLAWGWNRVALRPAVPLAVRCLVGLPLVALLGTLLAAFGATPAVSGGLGRGLWMVVRETVGPAGGVLLLLAAGAGIVFLELRLLDERWQRALVTVGRVVSHACATVLRSTGHGLVAAGRGVVRAVVALATWFKSALLSRPDLGTGRGSEPKAGSAVKAEREPVPEPETHSSPLIVEAEEEEYEEADDAEEDGDEEVEYEDDEEEGEEGEEEDDEEYEYEEDEEDDDEEEQVAATGNGAVRAADMDEHGVPIRRIPAEGGFVDANPQDVEDAVLQARLHAKEGTANVKKKRGRMVVPATDILDDVPETGPPVEEQELLDNSRTLTETLRDFGVTGRVGEVHPGPVITRYEFEPGPGVRVAQINNRQDDLALKLRAHRIRILAPIPGKAAVGVEVPNRAPAPIFLRRLLETKAYRDASSPLPLALGRDIGGAPVITELTKMPHLLIAGTTGSGKSVCMNALITSLILKRTPDELRLLMIDPKMLEFPMYNGIPHLLAEVVTDPKLAARTLKWALIEMERRYRVLSKRGARNIQSYNEKMATEGPRESGEEKLPYIVVLIDELADLMITSGAEVEEPIARLAQTARAVGIHLIVATQRPSVDVITGVIKANFPCRIAFQVATRHDSRTILDQNGAESLLGKGDMLYLPPGTGFPMRVHGAFVSESETQRLAEAWKGQGQPDTDATLALAMAEPEAAAGGLGDDPLFEDAARLVVGAGQASASMLQRRLKVGYARAARLVDMLEAAGVVSTSEGSKPREILMDDVRLEHVLAGTEE